MIGIEREIVLGLQLELRGRKIRLTRHDPSLLADPLRRGSPTSHRAQEDLLFLRAQEQAPG